MSQHTYGITRNLGKTAFEDAVTRVTAALKDEGFGVLTEIDVKATLKKKIDVDFTRYLILGACNPHLAYQALQAETELGLLLPCNVVVREDDAGDVHVSAVSPRAMFQVVDNPAMGDIAGQVEARLERVIAAT